MLSAGSIVNTELLVRAREKGLFLVGIREIGNGWGSNGDAIVIRSFSPNKGFTQASPRISLIHDASDTIPATYESWYVPGVPTDMGIQGTLCIAYDNQTRWDFVYDGIKDRVKLVWPEGASDVGISACQQINDRVAAAEQNHSREQDLLPLTSGLASLVIH